jgi:hypothetical protein
MRTFGVIEEKTILDPNLEIARAMGRALFRGIAAIVKFVEIAFAAMGTGESHCL